MNWKYFILFMLIAIGLSVAVGVWHPASAYYYVEQGSTVYLDQQVDISGIAAGIENLAWYGGYDCYGDNQYLLKMPKTKDGYYNFTIDREIFSGRLGLWCKWNGYVESNGNLKAFIVSIAKPIQFNATENQTLQNPNQTPIVVPRQPYLPVKHISDYLIARGNGFDIPVTGTTDVWIFGARDSLLDYHSIGGNVSITEEAINTLSPGLYKVLLHTQDPNKPQATVRYSKDTGQIDWFDPVSFAVNHFRVIDNTPETVLLKLQEIIKNADDTYRIFNLEVQDPTISINQIDSLNQLNETNAPQTQGISLGQQSYIDVRGYTNAAPDTIIRVGVDLEFNQAENRIWRDALATKAEGELGGNMREWKVVVPLYLSNMVPGRHFVSAKSALSEATISTADFYIYDNPAGNDIPNKTMRYVSGRYGPDEIVPTPTPIIVTEYVTKVVTQLVTVPVTPSNEQIYAQQLEAQNKINGDNWNRGALITGIVIVAIALIITAIYLFRVYRRAKKC